MTTLERKVYCELAKRLEENEYKEISITMKCNGDTVTITPMAQFTEKITDLKQVEYFLVNSPSLPWLSGDTLETVAKNIVNYKNDIEDHEDEKQELHEYFETHIKNKDCSDDEWGYYSDWHKDVYGYRPKQRDKFTERQGR